MMQWLASVLGGCLGKVLGYEKLVVLSSKLNLPLAPPIMASMSVTQRCNSKCAYCDIWKGEQHPDEASVDDFSRVFGSLRELGVGIVTLGGGEPLVRRDLEMIVSSAKRTGLSVDICTNGIALTEDRAFKLAEAGADCLLVSMDTIDPEIYARHRGMPFYLAERAIASLLSAAHSYPALWVSVNCVVTRHNIGTLVPLVDWIRSHGNGRIAVTFQPYHQPCPLPEPSQVPERLRGLVNSLRLDWHDHSQHDDLVPSQELRPLLEREIEELIQLKRRNPILPNNSEFYLKSLPDFLFDSRMPDGFGCVAGYTGIVLRNDFRVVLPCWRLPPVGDLDKQSVANVWFSRSYAMQRKAMKALKCPGCMLVCHREPGWYEWYNTIYKSCGQTTPRITR